MMAIGIGTSAQITVSESFEGTSLSTGWTSAYGGTSGTTSSAPSFGTSAGTPCAGAKEAYKNIYSGVTPWFLKYTSPVTSNGTDLNFSFKYLAKGYSTTGAIAGTFTAEYSTNGGTTWTTVPATTGTVPVTLNSQIRSSCRCIRQNCGKLCQS